MFTHLPSPAAGLRWAHAARWVARGLLILWAGFWTWFVVMTAATDDGGAWKYAGQFLAVLLIPAACAWVFPRLGGMALILIGAWHLFFFRFGTVQLILAAPAIGLGVLFLVMGWRRARAPGTPL